MHPTIHELTVAANPRPDRHLHEARPGRHVRRARRLVVVGSALLQLGIRLRNAGADRTAVLLGVRHLSGAPPGRRTV